MQYLLAGCGIKQMIYNFIWSGGAPWTLVVFSSVRSGTSPRSCPKGSGKSVMCIKLIIFVEDVFYIVLNIGIFCWVAPCAGDITGKHWTKTKEEGLQKLTISKMLCSCRNGDLSRKLDS